MESMELPEQRGTGATASARRHVEPVELSAQLMTEAAAVTVEAAAALQRGNLVEATDLDRRADALRRKAMRAAVPRQRSKPRRDQQSEPSNSGGLIDLLTSSGGTIAVTAPPIESHGAGGSLAPAPSERQLVADSLYELDAVATPALIGQYSIARFGESIDLKRLSSIRRDEKRAHTRHGLRQTFIVPALDGYRFVPVRAQLAVSTWPLSRRIVGPRSGRVELLRAALSVTHQLRWQADREQGASGRESTAQLLRLLRDLTLSVTGAFSEGRRVDPDAIEAAIREEYDALSPADMAWREEAALRAGRQLTETEQLWGAGPMQAVGNGRK
jgi:hypothetical protein